MRFGDDDQAAGRALNLVQPDQPERAAALENPAAPGLVEMAIATAIFAVLTILLTWPQVTQLSTHIIPHFDPLFSMWRLAWVAHQLPIAPLNLFDANIFHPEKATLTYSDAMLLLGILAAPAFWAGLDTITIYNTLVLLSFIACGPAMYLLARELGCSRLASVLAGIIFSFQPYRFGHYAHLELLWSCWIPLALWAFHRTLATRRARYAVLLALFVALQVWSCLYYGVFLVTVLPLLAVGMLAGRPLHEWRSLLPSAAACAMGALVFIGPYAIPYLSADRRVGDRSLADVASWSPPGVAYLSAQGGNWIYPGPPPNADALEHVLFPGAVAVVYAVVGLTIRPRRTVIAYAVVLLVALDLSYGLNGFFYRWLYDYVWPYDGLRVPARIFVMVSATLAVLAALGMSRALGEGATRGRSGLRLTAGIAVLMLATLESVGVPITLRPVKTIGQTYWWLRDQPRGLVFEWPVPQPHELGYSGDHEYMYYSTVHWHPLLNGYSGHFPESYIRLLQDVRQFPRTDVIEHLRQRGVRYLILHSGAEPKGYVEAVNALAHEPLVSQQFIENVGHEEIALYTIRPRD